MLGNIFSSIIEISLTSSIIILLLLVTPFIQKKYTAKWRYILWFILTIRLIIPFNITLPTTPVKLAIPTNTLSINQTINNNQSVVSLTDLAQLPQIQKTQEKSHNYSLIVILSYGWLLGTSIFLIRIFIIYSHFHHKIKKNNVVVTNSKILYILDQLCLELNIKRPRICLSKNRCSPMMYGFLKPTLVLSNLDYADYELEMILRHELIHFKRHDLWYKLLLIFANAIHWFNPLVYLMIKSAHADIEFSCDDEVIKDYDITSRKLYSQAILNSIKKERSQEVVLSTQFKGGKKC